MLVVPWDSVSMSQDMAEIRKAQPEAEDDQREGRRDERVLPSG